MVFLVLCAPTWRQVLLLAFFGMSIVRWESKTCWRRLRITSQSAVSSVSKAGSSPLFMQSWIRPMKIGTCTSNLAPSRIGRPLSRVCHSRHSSYFMGTKPSHLCDHCTVTRKLSVQTPKRMAQRSWPVLPMPTISSNKNSYA